MLCGRRSYVSGLHARAASARAVGAPVDHAVPDDGSCVSAHRIEHLIAADVAHVLPRTGVDGRKADLQWSTFLGVQRAHRFYARPKTMATLCPPKPNELLIA